MTRDLFKRLAPICFRTTVPRPSRSPNRHRFVAQRGDQPLEARLAPAALLGSVQFQPLTGGFLTSTGGNYTDAPDDPPMTTGPITTDPGTSPEGSILTTGPDGGPTTPIA